MTAHGEDAIDRVKAWLIDLNPDLSEIDLDLDLIETGVLDSLTSIRFVVFLEGLIGHELEADALTTGSFRTLRLVRDTILTT